MSDDNFRKKAVYRVNGRDVEINELTVGQIKSLAPENMQEFAPKLEELFEAGCGMSVADVDQLSPSQVRGLYEKFKEVNADFFDAAQTLGLMEAVGKVWAQIKVHFTNQLMSVCAALSAPGIETHSNTDGDSSPAP